jgi:hypothetical protein
MRLQHTNKVSRKFGGLDQQKLLPIIDAGLVRERRLGAN